jgi:hypothetical protein
MKKAIFICEAVFIIFLINFVQQFNSFNIKALFGYWCMANAVLLLFWLVLLIKGVKNKNGFFYKIFTRFNKMNIPVGLKIITIIVFLGNFIAISNGKPNYPFYDVGMFRWTSPANFQHVLYEPQYYFFRNNKVELVNIRREGFFLFHKYLGWGYTHEFTFSSAYHNKNQKENFDFLAKKMKLSGVDTLWVGVSCVNFKTKKVVFNPNLCNAIKINKNEDLYYGPIYIPEYQYAKCN